MTSSPSLVFWRGPVDGSIPEGPPRLHQEEVPLRQEHAPAAPAGADQGAGGTVADPGPLQAYLGHEVNGPFPSPRLSSDWHRDLCCPIEQRGPKAQASFVFIFSGFSQNTSLWRSLAVQQLKDLTLCCSSSGHCSGTGSVPGSGTSTCTANRKQNISLHAQLLLEMTFASVVTVAHNKSGENALGKSLWKSRLHVLPASSLSRSVTLSCLPTSWLRCLRSGFLWKVPMVPAGGCIGGFLQLMQLQKYLVVLSW